MTLRCENWNEVEAEWLADCHYVTGVPFWYDEKDKACKCGAPVRCLDKAVGFSDFLFFKLECTKCHHAWCGYVEG